MINLKYFLIGLWYSLMGHTYTAGEYFLKAGLYNKQKLKGGLKKDE